MSKPKTYEFSHGNRLNKRHLTAEQIADEAKADVDSIRSMIEGEQGRRATKTMIRILFAHISRLDRVARDK